MTEASLAVASHLEALLPPLGDLVEEMARAEASSQPGGLGPVVTVPAVYVRIVTTAYRAELLARQSEAMQAKIEKAEQKPGALLNDEAFNALAVRLANEAVGLSFVPLEGASALWKAAAMVAMVHTPSGVALQALDQMHAVTRADVARALGEGATKQ